MPGINALLDLIFPPRCVGCRSLGGWLCGACLDKVPTIEGPVCPKCGRPQNSLSLCGPCRSIPMQFSRARAVYQYEGAVRDALHRLKYRNLRAIAPTLSGLLVKYLETHPVAVDAVVAVPLHPDRLRERGYNQSELLAKEVARSRRLPLMSGPLLRTKHTRPQVGLGAMDRHSNMQHVFRWIGEPLSGLKLLLIDDVYTTGATLSDCARALKEVGASAVQALTVARGN